VSPSTLRFEITHYTSIPFLQYSNRGEASNLEWRCPQGHNIEPHSAGELPFFTSAIGLVAGSPSPVFLSAYCADGSSTLFGKLRKHGIVDTLQ